MSEFIIVFREVLEASLVVGIIYLILEKSNQLGHLYKLWLGVLAAIIAIIAAKTPVSYTHLTLPTKA